MQWIRLAHLINQHVSAEVFERKLELLEAVVDRDLDSDWSLGAGIIAGMMAWSRHGDGSCVCGCLIGTAGSPDGGDVFKLACAAGIKENAPFL